MAPAKSPTGKKTPARAKRPRAAAPEAGVADTVPADIKTMLRQSDARMSRVVEDLIEVLIRRNILNFTDLPRYAQKRLIQRSTMRRDLPARDDGERKATPHPAVSAPDEDP